MAEASAAAAAPAVAPSLSDFFSKKNNKKKIASSNLNKDNTTAKPEAKPKKKDAEDGEWQDDEPVVAASLNVQVAGNLRAEEKKDEEDAGRHWGAVKQEKGGSNALNNQKYPSLARSMHHKHAQGVDDGPRQGQISTAKNHFASLGGDAEDSEEEKPKNKPVTARKQKGEFEKSTKDREPGSKKEEDEAAEKKSRKGKKKTDEDGEEDEEEEEDDEEEDADEQPKEKSKKKEKERSANSTSAKDALEESEKAAALIIQLDDEAAKAKYKGRTKLAKKEIPAEDLEEEKENRAPVSKAGSKKKKFAGNDEEEEKQFEYVEE